jgi:hypothetical protein
MAAFGDAAGGFASCPYPELGPASKNNPTVLHCKSLTGKPFRCFTIRLRRRTWKISMHF